MLTLRLVMPVLVLTVVTGTVTGTVMVRIIYYDT
jgi:hypothetical protein